MGGNLQSLSFPTRSKEDFPETGNRQKYWHFQGIHLTGSQDQIKKHLKAQLKSSEALHRKTNPSLLTSGARKPSCCKLFFRVPMQSFVDLKEMSQAGEQGKRERKDCMLTCLLFLNYQQFLPPLGKITPQKSFPGL